MPDTNLTLVNKVFEALKNDETLAGMVKSFSKGNMNISRKIYPFVSVGNLHYTNMPATTGTIARHYNLSILAGAASLAPGISYEGNGADKAGILQIADAIVSVIRNNMFGGLLIKPVKDISYTIEEKPGSGGTMHFATIGFTGEHWVRLR